jgi:ubiquinone/menaquinone biosynthesis C-methylase UbiE
MGVYQRFVLPRLIALAMRNEALVPYRRRIGGAATGRVLELGIGSGLNLPLYGRSVRSVIGIEPSPALIAMAGARGAKLPLAFDLVRATGESLPLDAQSVDTVVTTWTLCSVADPVKVLDEARRVLKPGGRLLFCEHGRAPDARVERWQDRLTPIWKRVAGGCHLNRKIDALVVASGFRLDAIETGYLPHAPKFAAFLYTGQASPA